MFLSFSNNLGVVLLTNTSNYGALIQIENAVLNFAENTNFLIAGDLNTDGIINILDVIQLVNLVIESEYEQNGDINDDGLLNILDIIELINLILN